MKSLVQVADIHVNVVVMNSVRCAVDRSRRHRHVTVTESRSSVRIDLPDAFVALIVERAAGFDMSMRRLFLNKPQRSVRRRPVEHAWKNLAALIEAAQADTMQVRKEHCAIYSFDASLRQYGSLSAMRLRRVATVRRLCVAESDPCNKCRGGALGS